MTSYRVVFLYPLYVLTIQVYCWTHFVFWKHLVCLLSIFSQQKGQLNVAALMYCDNYYAISTLTPFLNEKSTAGCCKMSCNYLSFH